MTPGAGDASFWGHVPGWMWPIILCGILAFFVYELIKTSESVARIFGKIGRSVHERAAAPRKVLSHVEKIEEALAQTNDSLECATAYLVIDAEYHYAADLIVAENYPKLFQLLPKRVSYTDFQAMWRAGWRP